MKRGTELSTFKRPPNHLLLATDFSARTDRAQDRAVQLALQWNASLTAIHAIDVALMTDDPSPIEALRTATRRNAHLLQEEFAAIEGLRASVRVAEGKPRDVLLDLEARERAELITTGIAGNGPLGRAIVGSTVTALARIASVPLLVVKKRVLDTGGRIVVATDLSEASEPAMHAALRWFPHESVILFHAFDTPYRGFVDDKHGYDAGAKAAAVEQCRIFLGRVGGTDAGTVEIVARQGDAGSLLRAFVDERGVDLVVAGTHGRTGLAHAFLGSVAAEILDCVACDVLIVPSRQR